MKNMVPSCQNDHNVFLRYGIKVSNAEIYKVT